jgi:hypothetical protein
VTRLMPAPPVARPLVLPRDVMCEIALHVSEPDKDGQEGRRVREVGTDLPNQRRAHGVPGFVDEGEGG